MSGAGAPRVLVTRSEEETLACAADLARTLAGGSVVHLRGELGAGKTRFAKGLARGLGLDEHAVVSPTFTLVQVHAARAGARLGLVHVDLYRIAGPSELAELGLSEVPGEGAVAAVEWPERLAGRSAPGFVDVLLEDLGGRRRRITITAGGSPRPPAVLV